MKLQRLIHLVGKIHRFFAIHRLRRVFGNVKSIHLRQHAHIKRRGDVAIFAVAVNAHIVVVAWEENIAHHVFIAVEAEHNRLVFGEQRIKCFVAQTARVNAGVA